MYVEGDVDHLGVDVESLRSIGNLDWKKDTYKDKARRMHKMKERG